MRPSRWPVEQLASARGHLWPQRPAGDFGQTAGETPALQVARWGAPICRNV